MTTYYNAEFAAEFIVKRDPDGNWCEWNSGTSEYDSLITGLNQYVACMAEGPDGKIYVGGSFTDAGTEANADYLARWNPETEKWEAVISGASDHIEALAFDANGDLYVGGAFTNWGGIYGDGIVKITGLEPGGTPTVNALGIGIAGVLEYVGAIAISPEGDVYVGGTFVAMGGVSGASQIAKWDGAAWSALSTGLDSVVYALAFAPNGDLYIGGDFTNAGYPYLCKWDGSAFSAVGSSTDINGAVYALAFDNHGRLLAGGEFTNAGGEPNADYIARWNGKQWKALGTGTNDGVRGIFVDKNKVYVVGDFTTAGDLTLTDRVAVWSNGAWQPIDIDLPGTAYVYSILPASDGSLYIGGAFSTAGEAPDEDAVCGLSYEVEVAEEIEEAVDEDDIDPIDNTGV